MAYEYDILPIKTSDMPLDSKFMSFRLIGPPEGLYQHTSLPSALSYCAMPRSRFWRQFKYHLIFPVTSSFQDYIDTHTIHLLLIATDTQFVARDRWSAFFHHDRTVVPSTCNLVVAFRDEVDRMMFRMLWE